MAAVAASAPALAGVSVAPKADTINLIPAAAYWVLTAVRSASERVDQERALSAGPVVSRNDRALDSHGQHPELVDKTLDAHKTL